MYLYIHIYTYIYIYPCVGGAIQKINMQQTVGTTLHVYIKDLYGIFAISGCISKET